MAHGHAKGQLVVEALIVMLFILTVFLLIAGHMTSVKSSFEKKDFTKDSRYGHKKIFREK